MPRASRYLLDGYTYHLTHRCHDRGFLLKFREEREEYREWLRTAINRHGVSVYAYCITSNHVHVVAHAHDRDAIAEMMHLPSSAVARHLNRRTEHEGSVWEHPYQCTMIEDGKHLLNCLRYVDMNMVRAGVVDHPRDWRWCGYDELVGTRQRYRLIDIKQLMRSLDLEDTQDLARLHSAGVDDLIVRRSFTREALWSESLAVGSQEYVEKIKKDLWQRTRFEEECVTQEDQSRAWIVREVPVAYTADSGSKPAV